MSPRRVRRMIALTLSDAARARLAQACQASGLNASRMIEQMILEWWVPGLKWSVPEHVREYLARVPAGKKKP